MKAPHFWSAGLDPRSREAAPLTRLLLTPLATLYTFGIRRKLAAAEPEKIPARTVCFVTSHMSVRIFLFRCLRQSP